jgi:hypothetical protein
MERYLGHGTALDRIKAAMAVRAAGVLLRRHPAAVADAVTSGLVRGARVGVRELNQWLREREDARQMRAGDEPPAAPLPPLPRHRLSARDRRLLIRVLEDDARGTAPRTAGVASPPAEEPSGAP